MRRLAAAILAAPVIASIYIAALVTVPGARRYLAVVTSVLLVGVVGIALVMPPAATSTPPSTPRPILASELQAVETASGDTASADSTSSASSPAAVSVQTTTAGSGVTRPAPATTAVPDATSTPRATTTVAKPAVRQPTTARIAGTLLSGKRILLTSPIVLRFDRPVTVKAVRAAFAIKPAVKGTIRATSNRVYTFTPAAPLAANTAYTITFTKTIKDTDGVAVAARKPVRLLTAAAPALVRFRPAKGSTDIDPTALLSVRFTKPMNHATTQKAFSVVIAGKKVPGSITWAESDTVLVFTPKKALAKGSGVGVRVLGTATSADGVPIKAGGSATFKVVGAPKPTPTIARPAAKPVSKPASKPAAKPSGSKTTVPRSGGGSLGGGSWAAAEAYYLDLMNCTRTGGWVTSSGSCDSPGGRNVAPLWIDAGISANVSRPYAKYLASTGICSHFADGNPGTRLRRAGYDSYRWAENISCPKDMEPMALMVYTQQYFQNEKSYNGGHYVNLMNPLYDRVGIGVWVANGRAEVVIDFYRP